MPSESKGMQLAREAQQDILLLEKDVRKLETDLDRLTIDKLLQRVAVLEEKVLKLESSKLESEKRLWQYIFLAFGALLTVVGGILVSYFKRP